MTEKSTNRRWSTKTLARQLAKFLADQGIEGDTTVSDLMDTLKSEIVNEEVGLDLDAWATSQE